MSTKPLDAMIAKAGGKGKGDSQLGAMEVGHAIFAARWITGPEIAQTKRQARERACMEARQRGATHSSEVGTRNGKSCDTGKVKGKGNMYKMIAVTPDRWRSQWQGTANNIVPADDFESHEPQTSMLNTFNGSALAMIERKPIKTDHRF